MLQRMEEYRKYNKFVHACETQKDCDYSREDWYRSICCHFDNTRLPAPAKVCRRAALEILPGVWKC